MCLCPSLFEIFMRQMTYIISFICKTLLPFSISYKWRIIKSLSFEIFPEYFTLYKHKHTMYTNKIYDLWGGQQTIYTDSFIFTKLCFYFQNEAVVFRNITACSLQIVNINFWRFKRCMQWCATPYSISTNMSSTQTIVLRRCYHWLPRWLRGLRSNIFLMT